MGWANGLAHLLPGLAGRQNRQSVKTGKCPPRTRAEGGQVEPVLGRLIEFAPLLSWSKSLSLDEEIEDAH